MDWWWNPDAIVFAIAIGYCMMCWDIDAVSGLQIGVAVQWHTKLMHKDILNLFMLVFLFSF